MVFKAANAMASPAFNIALWGDLRVAVCGHLPGVGGSAESRCRRGTHRRWDHIAGIADVGGTRLTFPVHTSGEIRVWSGQASISSR